MSLADEEQPLRSDAAGRYDGGMLTSNTRCCFVLVQLSSNKASISSPVLKMEEK